MMENFLLGVEKPGRYVGNEINAYRKDFKQAGVRIALAFPDVYEVGMSHLGLQLLYHTLNGLDGVMADRVYAPWFDFESKLREQSEVLRGMESHAPIHRFDFVGFSLQYELSFSNILTILDLGRIPFQSGARGPEHPWIIAGGPCVFNPEPLADFFDFMVLGEAELVLPQVLGKFEQWRAGGGTRREFLEEIRFIEGIYVPSFFDVSYHSDGLIAEVIPRFPDYTQVRKRLVLDLDRDAPVPETPLVPLIDIVHNRLSIEIARGCTRGCRFCQAGFIYRPVRERHPQALLESARAALASSGFEELSLLSLSTGDYCHIQALLAALMERFATEKVAVSFPSMRVGTLTPEIMELVRRVRKTGFTLAPEAGSERLRRVINKSISDEDLLATTENAFKFGWRILKLYFMTGFPTESQADLDAMVELCLKVWKLAKPSRASVNISVSTLVPKPQTPFQWVAQLPADIVERRIEDLKEKLKRPGLRLKWHHPGHSLLEAVFARGDRRLGRVLLRAWELGVRFDGWTEVFREDLWKQAFEETGLDPEFYALRERSRDEILPWDHLSSGVERDFLWKEYECALSEQFTPDCRWDRCSSCGVCDHKTIRPKLHCDNETLSLGLEKSPASQDSQELFLYWFRYSKTGSIRFFGQLEIAQCLSRAIRRTGLPAAYSKGFHPHVKLSFDEALPLGLESLVEEAYLTLTSKLNAETVRSRLNQHLPEGLKIEAMAYLVKRLARHQSQKVTYRVFDLIPWRVRSIVQNWSQQLDEPLVKKTKKGEIRAELGDILLDVRQLSESALEMDICEEIQLCFRPTLILSRLLGEPAESFSGCRICKVALAPWVSGANGGLEKPKASTGS
jgi:radical SAM family uncharacterized protein/radical SAM-linked protein